MALTAESYLESCQSDFWKGVFREELGYLVKELKGYQNVLSVGCGPAIIELGLQEEGFDVTGLDVSEEALEGAPDRIRTVVGSAEDMEFDDAGFDAVIFVASLQFIENYQKALQETERVLRPDGKLIVMLLNPESEFFREKRKQADSYVNKIRHPRLAPIEGKVRTHFACVETEYFLGVEKKNIFESKEPDLAALYVLKGKKP
ncbi:methyltransferase domain-containing protein [Candidatus Micrarchaeota archaeon]|nr:methyltransferase domain-containing protein [Candidatus Micrarchaeota archaeon]